MSKSDATLPHGAIGLEVDEYAIEFRADKAILLRKKIGDHFTLQVGKNSGVLDLHRTWKDAEGYKHHETIFAMHRDHIPAFLAQFSSVPLNLNKLIRPLRLGWLGHHHIGIVWGVLSVDDSHVTKITRCSRRKRLVIDPLTFRGEIYVPEYLEDVWGLPNGAFSLWKLGRMIGIGMKLPHRQGSSKLYWIKMRDLTHLTGEMGKTFLEIAFRYAILPDEYHKYHAAERATPLAPCHCFPAPVQARQGLNSGAGAGFRGKAGVRGEGLGISFHLFR